MFGFTTTDLIKIERMARYPCEVEILPSVQPDFLEVRLRFLDKDLTCHQSYYVYQRPYVQHGKEMFIERFAFSAKKIYEDKE